MRRVVSNSSAFLNYMPGELEVLYESTPGKLYEEQYLRTKSKFIFRCGVFMNKDFQIVSSRPDGVINMKGWTIPVEIKRIDAYYSKDVEKKALADNFHQLQTHLFTCSNDFLFLHLYFVKSNKTRNLLYFKDKKYESFFMPIIEKSFYQHVLWPLFENEITQQEFQDVLKAKALLKYFNGNLFSKLVKPNFKKEIKTEYVKDVQSFCKTIYFKKAKKPVEDNLNAFILQLFKCRKTNRTSKDRIKVYPGDFLSNNEKFEAEQESKITANSAHLSLLKNSDKTCYQILKNEPAENPPKGSEPFINNLMKRSKQKIK